MSRLAQRRGVYYSLVHNRSQSVVSSPPLAATQNTVLNAIAWRRVPPGFFVRATLEFRLLSFHHDWSDCKRDDVYVRLLLVSPWESRTGVHAHSRTAVI